MNKKEEIKTAKMIVTIGNIVLEPSRENPKSARVANAIGKHPTTTRTKTIMSTHYKADFFIVRSSCCSSEGGCENCNPRYFEKFDVIIRVNGLALEEALLALTKEAENK